MVKTHSYTVNVKQRNKLQSLSMKKIPRIREEEEKELECDFWKALWLRINEMYTQIGHPLTGKFAWTNTGSQSLFEQIKLIKQMLRKGRRTPGKACLTEHGSQCQKQNLGSGIENVVKQRNHWDAALVIWEDFRQQKISEETFCMRALCAPAKLKLWQLLPFVTTLHLQKWKWFH